eukprot:Anaeramoba_ignava/a479308_24.p1 GENE.a479308_24~~a479308_24.p1  ORF type:complete len:236 (+),score=12.34 a479308_24:21-728(+)
MTVQEILRDLEEKGSESTKNIFMKHGAKEPFFGNKVADLKVIQKKIKKDYKLSLELYDTGNSDAMYLAGLIADESKMTKKDLQHWADKAYWYMISEYTVAWVTAESRYGMELALKWIDSPKENIASAGWATLASISGIRQDEELDIGLFSKLLDRAAKELHSSQNRVRYTMNGFVIATGANLSALTEKAKKIAEKIGKVNVDMGGTACKVPPAKQYIEKVENRGSIGKKRKTARC